MLCVAPVTHYDLAVVDDIDLNNRGYAPVAVIKPPVIKIERLVVALKLKVCIPRLIIYLEILPSVLFYPIPYYKFR